jgi:hypothetical protein
MKYTLSITQPILVALVLLILLCVYVTWYICLIPNTYSPGMQGVFTRYLLPPHKLSLLAASLLVFTLFSSVITSYAWIVSPNKSLLSAAVAAISSAIFISTSLVGLVLSAYLFFNALDSLIAYLEAGYWTGETEKLWLNPKKSIDYLGIVFSFLILSSLGLIFNLCIFSIKKTYFLFLWTVVLSCLISSMLSILFSGLTLLIEISFIKMPDGYWVWMPYRLLSLSSLGLLWSLTALVLYPFSNCSWSLAESRCIYCGYKLVPRNVYPCPECGTHRR